MLAVFYLHSFICLIYLSNFSVLHIIFVVEAKMQRPTLGLVLCDLESLQCILQSLRQGRPELINSALQSCCDICVWVTLSFYS